MVICQERGANELLMVQLMTLPPIVFVIIQNGLPFWCQFSQVVLEKRPLNKMLCRIHWVSLKGTFSVHHLGIIQSNNK